MYSFSPLADIPVTHDGFVFAVIICLFIYIFGKIVTDEDLGMVCIIAVLIAYAFSYHVFDQTPKTFANTKVTAELVGFQPEGYNEKSGKSRADRHYMYVVYNVSGEHIILQAREGTTYPKTAILYKN